jgi:hypothetical protein
VSKIYEVRSIARSDDKLFSWGARYSRAEADELLAERITGKNTEWANKYHKQWWIEEIDTSGLFEIPPAPSPRERFSTKITEVETGEGTLNTIHVHVLDQAGQVVAGYDRNYPSLFRTFEPFRQGDRLLALISTHYTATSVMDLTTGEVIASEEPHSMGFCPTGFYVPDWWDIHDGSVLPGSMGWRDDYELPKGDFGFVWGCIWGDDSSWKVQYLDLSRVQQGELCREERFGYLELATHPKLDAKEFIECSFYNGKREVRFSVLTEFDLDTGHRLGEDENEPEPEPTVEPERPIGRELDG